MGVHLRVAFPLQHQAKLVGPTAMRCELVGSLNDVRRHGRNREVWATKEAARSQEGSQKPGRYCIVLVDPDTARSILRSISDE